MNKKTVFFLSAALMLSAPALLAAEKDPTPQQQRMKDCNAEAKKKELAGDARKEFMSKCLSGVTTAAAAGAATQQDKMKSCNEQAGKKNLAGEERKKFMSECLSAKGTDDAADKKAEAKKDDKSMTQQDRMKSCNADAKKKGLAGDERRKFMSDCLSAG